MDAKAILQTFVGLWAGGKFITLKYESIALNSWFVVTSGLGYGASEGLEMKRTLDNKSSDNSIYPLPKKAKGGGGELLLLIDFMPLF